ncbi:Octopamine receptor [Eumeta japonica]|uniref:Octopamine receptor n=1 Tax=Eumeta variegata TaxID=151549 RepID=A0A4C1Y4V9_EUMVA|nr:Octopamine receptor [Eumeta japonica]
MSASQQLPAPQSEAKASELSCKRAKLPPSYKIVGELFDDCFFHKTRIGIDLAVPEWEALLTVLILAIVILGTIFGNILVILGVFTHKPLRIVQNFFIVSLAAADMTVAILVMPLNVAYSVLGLWLWGKHLCKIWLTCDILCCTSSILNLCAIALDRYWAITDPINYANKRNIQRVIVQITGIWILSLIISSPPLLGWNDWPEEFSTYTPCRLTSEPGYVIYSSFGSFFIPLAVMTIVYAKIYTAAKQRFRRRTISARACKRRSAVDIENLNLDNQEKNRESGNSESNLNEENENDSDSSQNVKRCQRKEFLDIKKNLFLPLLLFNEPEARRKIQSDIDQFNADSTGGHCSRKIKSTLRRVSQKRRKQEKPFLAAVNKEGDSVHHFVEQRQKISLSKERRAARTLGVVMGVFVICWLPFFALYVVLPFCPLCCLTNRSINFITWLGYINSTLNPLIYTVFNMDFRRAFKKLLRLD